MEQVKVTLKPDEYTALFRLCERELRNPADQVHFLIIRELQRRKLLQPNTQQAKCKPQEVRT